jgi:glutamate dehydrogenase
VQRRQAEGRGYTRPEIAVLLSWAKIALSHRLMQRDVADDPATEALLFDYFPGPMRERFAVEIKSHQLRREIIVNRITNAMINEVGPTMAVRLADSHGGGNNDAAYAYLAVREIYDCPALWQSIHDLDGKVDGAVQLELYARIRELMFEQIARLIRFGRSGGLAAMIERYRPAVGEVEARLDDVMADTQKELVAGTQSDLVDLGAPVEIARRISQCYVLTVAPTARVLAEESGCGVTEAARTLYRCLSFFRVGELLKRTRQIGATDYYDRLAIQGALEALEEAAGGLAGEVLAAGDAAAGDLARWAGENAPAVVRAKATVDHIADGGELTVSRLSVAAQQVRDIARHAR